MEQFKLMDNFKEEIVVKRNRTLDQILYGVCWISIVVFGLIALTSFYGIIGATGFNWVSLVIAVVFGALAFLLWRNKDKLRTEYEYSFTNGDLDISMVLGNSRRRYLTRLPLKSVEACGLVTDPSFNRYVSMRDVKKHNWFLNRDAKLYYFYFTKNSVKHLIVIEPSDEMVEMIRSRNYLNYGVWQG